ncbi:GAF domain-containing protein [Streptomyces naphthomycinicus]|uniref:GAF domain-containing protein n=1 Tax=Streptomyces naphthomycinicus TaxID=2872625 RepID=UPI001CED26B3|nr:GAF and ANTAR domain-containing protein [Streptomyces sp. TML10]
MSREQQLAEALVGLADSFADDVDPVVLADRLARNCIDLTGADAVGIMVVSARGALRTMAVTEEQAAFLEFLQLQADEGPCLDSFRHGRRIDVPDLEGSTGRWPRVAPLAAQFGYRSVHALPLRVHRQTVGAVNLLLRRPGGLPALDVELAQALADVMAVALVSWRPEPLRPADISSRVQAALAAKATVDMSVGMLAEAGGLTLAEAREALRGYAEHRHGRPVDTARALVQRTLRPDAVLDATDRAEIRRRAVAMDVADASDASDVADASDASDASDLAEAAGATEATAVANAPDVTAARDGAHGSPAEADEPPAPD